MADREQRIRERAYRIWQEEGCPHGRDAAHWDMASELVAQEDNAALMREPNPVAQGSDRAIRDQPVEPPEALENQGEFPVLTDQADKPAHTPRRSRPRKAAPRSAGDGAGDGAAPRGRARPH